VNLRGVLRNLRTELSTRYRGGLPSGFSEPFEGIRGLEIGGPSACFERGGIIPVYPMMSAIDGVQPSARTTWHDLDPAAGYVLGGERRGELHLLDDIELGTIPDDAYGAVFCSHVIEHIANPLRALEAWRRVTVPGGYLLMVAPHMTGTFDHRRPLTPLGHMVEDLEANTGEDDLTHLEEFLENHDSERNVRGVEDPDFVSELRENARTRLLHHHTFMTASLVELLDYAGLKVLRAEARLPHDIFVIGRWAGEGERTDEGLALAAARSSPFRSDRRAARDLATGSGGNGLGSTAAASASRTAPTP
jgi:SAM-dependent methyltransferase